MRSMVLMAAMGLATLNTMPAGLNAAVVSNEPDFQKLADQHSPAIVTIKFVLKMSMGGMGEQEQDTETFGLMIDKTGLIMVSNTTMGGFAGMMRQMRGMEMSIKPTNIKVLVGDDTVGVEAKLIARDTELDLAWVRIDKPAEKGYAAVDLKSSAELKLGEKFYTVGREGKFFDRVVSVNEGRVAAVAKKPRHLFLPGGEMGMPVFNGAGQLVGVSVLQMPQDDEGEGGGGFFGGGMGGPAILPASEIITATERALKTAAEGGGEAAGEKKDEANAEGKGEGK